VPKSSVLVDAASSINSGFNRKADYVAAGILSLADHFGCRKSATATDESNRESQENAHDDVPHPVVLRYV